MPVDFIFKGTVEQLDPQLSRLVASEDRRQLEKIILIPSESIAPPAVRELMASSFGNIYAEGYPRPDSRQQTQTEILDIDAELAYFHRYSDPRYYKGVEFADILEAITRRRAAELFAANGVDASALFINVQPLSGSPANSAVYSALLDPGDTIMGLDLIHGGHLTHGSKVSRSGKLYHSVPYQVDLESEQLDFDAIESLALEAKPRLIVAGYTAYPLKVDWSRFRVIADKCGAYLMADIAHISGLVAAGVHPSPIGIADIVTTTTHKSLCGPRGAMILTHRADLAQKIDRSVFPGEQGGPHLNNMAALALALKLANTDEFRNLQRQVIKNSSRLAHNLANLGIRIVAGGSENHLLLLDMKSIHHNGVHLTGDMAARILDVAGFVTNSNTIPGDKSAFSATGIRLGTVWISQLGYAEREIDSLSEAIANLLKGCKPFIYAGSGSKQLLRSKVDPEAMLQARNIVSQITGLPRLNATGNTVELRGEFAEEFLDQALASDVRLLKDGESQHTRIFGPEWESDALLVRKKADHYLLQFPDEPVTAARAAEWFQDLSDGYILFDDIYCKLPGPIVSKVVETVDAIPAPDHKGNEKSYEKPYFIGHQHYLTEMEPLPDFSWEEVADAPLRLTSLHETHIEMGGRMVPFGGWDMPVWYSSVSEEHAAVRQAAGLFDVSHMGVLEVSGPHAASFLDYVTTNDVSALDVGRSHYSYLLLPNGSVVDDLFIYRRGTDNFMLVVNAANNDKDWAWLNAVNEGKVIIDNQRPWARIMHPAVIRDLRDPQWGNECRVDIALQGPNSTAILTSLWADSNFGERLTSLPWSGLTEGTLGRLNVIVSRTGYTGERIAYELFIHPDSAKELWYLLVDAGKKYGLKPCGLASRDSTRTEAGLPLYGHELAGPLNLNPADAGFGSYVKLWKPFFIGREAFIAHEQQRDRIVIRFRMDEKGVRRAELGDPVLDKRGKIVGTVTSCAIDSDGYLLGQAVVPLEMAIPETPIFIYQLGGGKRPLRLPTDLSLGSKMPLPDKATVLSRFPRFRN